MRTMIIIYIRNPVDVSVMRNGYRDKLEWSYFFAACRSRQASGWWRLRCAVSEDMEMPTCLAQTGQTFACGCAGRVTGRKEARPCRATSSSRNCAKKPGLGRAGGCAARTAARASFSVAPRRAIRKASSSVAERLRPSKQCTSTVPPLLSAASMKLLLASKQPSVVERSGGGGRWWLAPTAHLAMLPDSYTVHPSPLDPVWDHYILQLPGVAELPAGMYWKTCSEGAKAWVRV